MLLHACCMLAGCNGITAYFRFKNQNCIHEELRADRTQEMPDTPWSKIVWAVVKTVMNLRVTQNSGNFPSRWQTAAFCRMAVLHAVVGQSLY